MKYYRRYCEVLNCIQIMLHKYLFSVFSNLFSFNLDEG